MNKEEKEILFAELTAHLEQHDAVFCLDGPVMVTVRLADNTYRKKTMASLELYLASIYVGQKDTIFVFQVEEIREETADFAAIELSTKDIDAALPFFLPAVQMWMREKYAARNASREATITAISSVRALVHLALNFEAEDSVVTEAKSDEDLAVLPMFGMF